MWGGNFNLVSDGQKDKQGVRSVTHEKSRENVKCMIDIMDLVDIWRTLNSDTSHFTRGRNCLEIKCRLGFSPISSSSISVVANAYTVQSR